MVWAVQLPLNNHHRRQYDLAILVGANDRDPQGYLDAQAGERQDGIFTIVWRGRGNEGLVSAREVILVTAGTNPPDDLPPAGDDDDGLPLEEYAPPARDDDADVPPEGSGPEDEDLFEDSSDKDIFEDPDDDADKVEDPEAVVANEPRPQDADDPQNEGWGRCRPAFGDLPLPWGPPQGRRGRGGGTPLMRRGGGGRAAARAAPVRGSPRAAPKGLRRDPRLTPSRKWNGHGGVGSRLERCIVRRPEGQRLRPLCWLSVLPGPTASRCEILQRL